MKSFNLEKHIDNLVDVIIFDSIVGNSDRHQENWGIITNFKEAIDELDRTLNNDDLSFFTKAFKKFERGINKIVIQKFKETNTIGRSDLIIQSGILPNEFAPIYDSGCCLGRENLDEKIHKMLNDKQMLNAYVKKGVSEIHWDGEEKKKNHFDLIKLVKTEYGDKVLSTIQSVRENYKENNLEYLINNMDLKLPDELKQFKLEQHRKELMFKLITLRLELLFNII